MYAQYIGTLRSVNLWFLVGFAELVCEDIRIYLFPSQLLVVTSSVNGEGILIVEDELLILESGRETLESSLYRIFAASRGSEALEVFRERHTQIQLVVLDMIMPGMDGFQTKDALRQLDPAVRIVAVVAFVDRTKTTSDGKILTAFSPNPTLPRNCCRSSARLCMQTLRQQISFTQIDSPSMTHILAIDDEPLILESVELSFPDDQVTLCATAQAGIDAFLNSTPDVVLCDIRLPDMSGMEAFEKLHRIDAKVPIILMTGRGTAGTAIEAMQRGAFEYILKPFNLNTLIPLIEDAAATSRMTRVRAVVPESTLDDTQADGSADLLIGNCDSMQEVYRSIGRVARQNVTALILGESGTGKEVIARAIYQYSERASGRFLAINCAAIPENLLESELFGHEKGSFTGAERKKVGKFELCNDGTLFLDEIGDMTPLMQTKILRVLQDQSFERVGGTETIRTNARIIAATNRNLEQAIEDKEFRSDLFYRLNVYTIHLPALRERGGDVALLANYFLKRFAKELSKQMIEFAPEAIDLINAYSWPGNVRELQSAVKHALLEATGPVIVPAYLPEAVRQKSSTASIGRSTGSNDNGDINVVNLTLDRLASGSQDIHRELVNLVERDIFATVLKHTDGNLTQASRHLGITRTTLRARLDALGISLEKSATVS